MSYDFNILFIFLFYLRIKITNQIYHGCFTKNADGTNRIIPVGERYLCLTSQPFWKFPEDILDLGVKTRSQTKKKQQCVTKETYDQYFDNKKRFHQWISSSGPDITSFT